MEPVTDTSPLVDDDHHPQYEHKQRLLRTITAVSVVVSLLLLISTIVLAVLYGNSNNDRNSLPQWPSPSGALLGSYSRATVAADNVFCSEIGRNVLIRGGNAVEAVIAVMFCLGAVNPHSSGLGGGHFMTIYNSTTKKCHVIDAREVAPLTANESMYKGHPLDSQLGWKAIAVPGELHGLRTAYEKFGEKKITWNSLIQPTIELLQRGIPVGSGMAVVLQLERNNILNESTLQDFVDPKTKDVWKRGDNMKGTRKMFIDTLRYLADSKDPIRDFYDGSMTDQMVQEFEDNDGLLTREDFRRYRSMVRQDDEIIYTQLSNDDLTICGPPPPSSSAVTQSIIKILDGFTYDTNTFDGNVDQMHKFIEAAKFAYAKRAQLGDMAFEEKALQLAKSITSDEFANDVRQKITSMAHSDSYYGANLTYVKDSGTTNIAVIDANGNSVVVTTTINLFFGARVASESTGVIWNSQMDDFSDPHRPNYYGYPPSPANFIKPGKRPMSSISPLVLFNRNNGNVMLSIGGAGGSTIISSVSQVALRVLRFGLNAREANDRPRIHNQLMPNITQYERDFPQAYVSALSSRGHVMESIGAIGEVTLARRVIKNNSSFLLHSTSDHRKGDESQPAGF